MARDSNARPFHRRSTIALALSMAVLQTACAQLPSRTIDHGQAARGLEGSDQLAAGPVAAGSQLAVRGQDGFTTPAPPNSPTPGSATGAYRYPMPVSGAVMAGSNNRAHNAPPQSTVAPVQYSQPFTPTFPEFAPPADFVPPSESIAEPPVPLPLDVFVEEERTGRFMFGAAVNSDLGVTGQFIVDERNFDIFAPPTSFTDILNGTAFRGRGQGFRFEAVPGTQVQRYLVNFTEPYLLDTDISMSLSAFYFDRRYFDWDEQRQGGRLSFGYRLTPDLSLASALRTEQVDIHDLRVGTIPELNAVEGKSDLYSGRVALTHDTRDMPFGATEGHFIQLSYEQVFGTFDYPRGDLDFRRYFLVRERPDGSGRHTLAYSFRLGVSGAQTPIFENYFAGGYSTLRGFDFRGASPRVGSVTVGGRFQFLGSVEYLFPLTADDMIKGALFVDYGTVERDIELNSENYRVAPGVGVRIAVPALGPAPLAFDLAFPVAKADGDDVQNFSFFFGWGRN